MIKILIVDDSLTETAILKQIFESDKDIDVIACAKNGKDAIELTKQLHPDLITMDIQMPIMDGFEATRVIMAQCPTPIVVISSNVKGIECQTTFKALEAGALSVLDKPVDINSSHFTTTRQCIIETVKTMAEIKVVRRRLLQRDMQTFKIPVSGKFNNDSFELIAIGTSVGGPQALKSILSELPSDFAVPIVVVQHMTKGFMTGFTSWLNDNTKLNVKNAENNEPLKKGVVYFAPDDFHLEIMRKNGELFANLQSGKPVSGFCPSATMLLRSVARTCGPKAIGILLTGMGSDGAEGLLEIKQAKGHTLIQDAASTVVFGMAGVAQSLGAVDRVVELDQMAGYLINILKQ